MILDLDRAAAIDLSGHYDVCIAGGGVAGIVIALKLAARRRRVLLLEAGGFEFSEASQSLYKGTNEGRAYFDLDVPRLRYFGGTSNHWGGWCRPLDALDFEKRDYLDGSGWPIGIDDLQPYLAPAREIMEIADFPAETPLEGSRDKLKEFFFRWSPPVRFGEKYRQALADSQAIDVLLNANLVDIETDPDSGRVTAFACRGYDDSKPSLMAVADRYVLALGGIENPRMLLNANGRRGLGNEHDLVGRYFMDHPHRRVGYYVADSTRTRFGSNLRFISPTAKLMRRKGIANAGFRLLPMEPAAVEEAVTEGAVAEGAIAEIERLADEALCASDIIAEFVRAIEPLNCRPDRSGILRVAAEQAPNRNSRVRLSETTDRFGLHRAVLDWELLPIDKKTIRIGALEIARYFARRDIGRVKILSWILDQDNTDLPETDPWLVAGSHHMGTTRMGASARDGVVDKNCRLFGSDNLHIAGSSVFCTSGHANPTLTIVQLALRLADHLAPA